MKLLNVDEAAELLGVAKGTVYHWACRGHIPAVRLTRRCLRFDPEQLAAWVGERSDGGARSLTTVDSQTNNERC